MLPYNLWLLVAAMSLFIHLSQCQGEGADDPVNDALSSSDIAAESRSDDSSNFIRDSPYESDLEPDSASKEYLVLVYFSGSRILAKGLKGELVASGSSGVDDVSVIKSAIDHISTGNILLIGTFYITSPIDNLKNGISLSGIPHKTEFDCSNIRQSAFYVGRDGYSRSIAYLTNDVRAGSWSVKVNDAGSYGNGDYVKLVDDEGIGGFKKGEILRISKIDGKKITFDRKISDTYRAKDNASIRKLEMIEDIRIDGIKFKGPGMNTSFNLFDGYLLKNFEFSNNLVSSFGKGAVHLADSLDCTISGNSIQYVFRNGFGYSIVLMNGCRNITISSNSFKHMGRHYIAIGGESGTLISGGFCRDIIVKNNYFSDSTQEAINTHEPFVGPINITGNTFVNCAEGIQIANGNTNIVSNTFKDCREAIKIIGNEPREHYIKSNTFENCEYEIYIHNDYLTLTGNPAGGHFYINRDYIEYF
jgi:hypothetical protein